MSSGRFTSPVLAALLATVFVPASAWAAACCMSASVVGNGRLAAWEEAAAGLSTAWSHGTGRWDAQGHHRPYAAGLLQDEVRVDALVLARVSESWQLSARVPWVTGVRASEGPLALGTGVGDASVAARWDAVALGEWEHLPGVALQGQLLLPTGRRPEQAGAPLGADATGRGTFAASLGVALEYAQTPWFVRLDAAGVYNAPFLRVDTGRWQSFGPGVQVALSSGRELFTERLVLAASLRLEHELEQSVAGVRVEQSASTGLVAAASASLKLTPHWVLLASASTEAAGPLGLSRNRDERFAFSLGVRHGFF